MARIYVSSTYTDLEECRQQVSQAIRRMGHVDVAMEYYVAEDARPLDRCLADVRASDLYVCVVAWRYGYVPPGQERAITELEYDAAVDAKVPRLAFLLEESASWPFDRVERAALDQVERFRARLREERLAGSFTGPQDIGAAVTQAISAWERSRGGDEGGPTTDWDTYRQAVVERHRWVRLSVIAGAQRDRLARIPLSDVFVPQRVEAGRPHYDVPEEVLRAKQALLAHGQGAADAALLAGELLDPEGDAGEDAAAEDADGGAEALVAGKALLTGDDSAAVLGREAKQVVLGGPGSGKSTLCHYAMLAVCDAAWPPERLPPQLRDLPVPLLIELRHYVTRRSPDFETFLVDHVAEQYGATIGRDALRQVLAEGRALVFFDGLDEVFELATRARVVGQFQVFARRYPRSRIVVTSRIAGYDDSDLGLAGFEHYTLLDFGLAEVRQFVPRWFEHYTVPGEERDAAGLLRRITDNPRLLDLAGNPLLLTMMAIVFRHQDLPEQRWQLYARCTDVLLEDWDVKRKNIERDALLPLDVHVGKDQKAEILQRVSVGMLAQGRPGQQLNAIAYDPLRDVIAGYLEERYGKPPGEAQAIAVDILNHLRERTYILAEIGDRVFGFVHRTFMEYFAARHHLAEFNRRKADYGWLIQDVFLPHWEMDQWREVLLLLVAMLAHQGSPIREVVDTLRPLLSSASEARLGLIFAARCLGEAGPAGVTDEAWARALLDDLTGELAEAARRAPRATGLRRDDDRTLIEEGLSAFVRIAQFVPASEPIRRRIDDLQKPKRSLQERLVGWQLDLALRPRDEKLGFALAALSHGNEEAVRRGAVAALEREWAGHEQAGAALLEVFRSGTHTRVRQAAFLALQRGWPALDPRLLDAVADRVAKESAPTFVSFLASQLSTAWRDDGRARELLVELVGRCPVGLDDVWSLCLTGAGLLVDGWGQAPEALAWLRAVAVRHDEPRARLTALLAIGIGWGDSTPEVNAWALDRLLADQAILRLEPRSAILDVYEPAATREFFERRVTKHPDPAGRSAALRFLTWQQPALLADHVAYAHRAMRSDRDAGVRRDAVAVLARAAADEEDWIELLRAAFGDPDGSIRGAAITEVRARLAGRSLFDRDRGRIVFSSARLPIVEAVAALADGDPDPAIRQLAVAALVTAVKPRVFPTALINVHVAGAATITEAIGVRVVDWLRSRATDDADPTVRTAAYLGIVALPESVVDPDLLTQAYSFLGAHPDEVTRAHAVLVAAGLASPDLREWHSLSWRDPWEAGVWDFVEGRALNDRSPGVRLLSTLLFAKGRHRDDTNRIRRLLRNRIRRDDDETIRTIVKAAANGALGAGQRRAAREVSWFEPVTGAGDDPAARLNTFLWDLVDHYTGVRL